MKKSTENKPLPTARKRLFQIILFICYPLYVLHSLVVAPLFTVCDSNVAINEAFTVFLYYVMVLIDVLVFFISFSVIIYGMCIMPLKNMKKTLALIFLSPFFKYLLKFIISPMVDGIPSIDMLIVDVYSYCLSGCLEVAQYAIVLLLSYGAAKKYRDGKMLAEISKENIKEGSDIAFRPLVPFKKLFSFKNPLQRGAIFSSVIICVGRIASLAISDINMNWKIVGINQYLTFFAPYLIETIVGLVGYFLMLYITRMIYRK